ncbi:flagellar biosynthesis regulator FlaF [Brytella acorum]|uniref:Flagellin assembly protein n=1 Tax=Brytella acorum TaxID=2959299 RepID=A0AA35UXQ6_9PROT|nr:flagellar biosynthesis regulator FlaF [Brytella acorum]MDF3625401.1 flagellar biosynthesis regulator FlaF [Brytella acorum]CAI9121535.1 flagellin assembly protein [Brytella acorum]
MNYGASRYQQQSGADLSSRQVEALAFKKVNELMANPKSGVDRREALSKNYRLWSILLLGIGRTDNLLPPVLKSDLTKIATWMLRETNVAFNTVGSLQKIIDVNADMIAGLSAVTAAEITGQPETTSAFNRMSMVG